MRFWSSSTASGTACSLTDTNAPYVKPRDVDLGGDAGVAPSRLSRQPCAQWFIIRPLTVRVPVMSRPEAELPGAPETPVARPTVHARWRTRSGPDGRAGGGRAGGGQYDGRD